MAHFMGPTAVGLVRVPSKGPQYLLQHGSVLTARSIVPGQNGWNGRDTIICLLVKLNHSENFPLKRSAKKRRLFTTSGPASTKWLTLVVHFCVSSLHLHIENFPPVYPFQDRPNQGRSRDDRGQVTRLAPRKKNSWN